MAWVKRVARNPDFLAEIAKMMPRYLRIQVFDLMGEDFRYGGACTTHIPGDSSHDLSPSPRGHLYNHPEKVTSRIARYRCITLFASRHFTTKPVSKEITIRFQ